MLAPPCGVRRRAVWRGAAGLVFCRAWPVLCSRRRHPSGPRPDHKRPLPVYSSPRLYGLSRAVDWERRCVPEFVGVAALAAIAFGDTRSSGIGGTALVDEIRSGLRALRWSDRPTRPPILEVSRRTRGFTWPGPPFWLSATSTSCSGRGS